MSWDRTFEDFLLPDVLVCPVCVQRPTPTIKMGRNIDSTSRYHQPLPSKYTTYSLKVQSLKGEAGRAERSTYGKCSGPMCRLARETSRRFHRKSGTGVVGLGLPWRCRRSLRRGLSGECEAGWWCCSLLGTMAVLRVEKRRLAHGRLIGGGGCSAACH
jgi:hypothetical protein